MKQNKFSHYYQEERNIVLFDLEHVVIYPVKAENSVTKLGWRSQMSSKWHPATTYHMN